MDLTIRTKNQNIMLPRVSSPVIILTCQAAVPGSPKHNTAGFIFRKNGQDPLPFAIPSFMFFKRSPCISRVRPQGREYVFHSRISGMWDYLEEIEAIDKAHRLIPKDMRVPHALPSIANRVKLNETRLKYVFSHVFKTNIYDYMLGARMEKAKYLLQHTRSQWKKLHRRPGTSILPNS